MNNTEFDIAIVGAGLVGLPLSLALSRQGWRVALLDAAQPPQIPPAGGAAAQSTESSALSERCTALSLATQRWFEEMELWPLVAADACAIHQVNVSHKGYFGGTRLVAEELGVPAVGYVIDNNRFLQQLGAALPTSSVHRFYNARVCGVSREPEAVRLSVEGQPELTARLVIATDGVGSVVRETAGIATTQVDYQQSAVLLMVEMSQPHEGVAFERFTASGPLAFLPRFNRCMNVVECIEPDEQSFVESLTDAQYLERLQRRFGYRLGRLKAVGPRYITPLIRIEAQSQIAPRTALFGNAARLLHPVGGQGYNLAVRDMALWVSMLAEGPECLADPGNALLLQQFSEQRAADQKRVVQFTDLMARGFRGRAAIPSHLRATALTGLDLLTPARHWFAKAAMGFNS